MFIRPGTGHPIAESLQAAAALGDSLVFLCPRRARTFCSPYDELSERLSIVSNGIHLLVDGSTGAAFLADLEANGAQVTPLFSDATEPELLAVAPRLVGFENARLLLERFGDFWARSVASVLISSAATDALASHLRRNLYVEDPAGEFCLLRFHDPRVLCRLSETLFDEQAEEFFGDIIDSFLFEGPSGELRIWSPEVRR